MAYATSTTKEYNTTSPDIVTTWAYCWRCGKKIPDTHINEQQTGVHKRCETRTWLVPMLILQQVDDKHLQLRWKMSN